MSILSLPHHFVLVSDRASGLYGLEVAHAMGVMKQGVALLSSVGAGCFMGAPWWHALVRELEEAVGQRFVHVLDCATSPAHAVMALTLGQRVAILLENGNLQNKTAQALYKQEGGILLSKRPETITLK
ncbi:MAG: hypothetical protein IJ934_01030 [Acetobacter sp.]|nr:hypothetical protein [Acetobacter sp.]